MAVGIDFVIPSTHPWRENYGSKQLKWGSMVILWFKE